MVGIKHNIGIIGFGGMARFHYSYLTENNYERAKFKGVFDINPEACKVALNRGMPKIYSSKEEMFADSEIDLIIIATTNDAHKDLSVEAMRAGKNVLCEKPVTLSCEELLEIMEVAKETGKVFTINQNRRTNLDVVSVKRQIDSGLLGNPYLFESRVEGSRGMPSGWRTIKALGGGMMLDWGVHLIDQIMHVILPEDKVKQVFCKMSHIQYSEVEDGFHLVLTMESGINVIIEVGTNNFIPHSKWYVYGTDGTMTINNWEQGGKIVRCKDRECEWDEDIVITSAGPTKTMAPRNKFSTETIEFEFPKDVTDDLTVVYDQFIDAVEGKAELTIKPEQALRVMQVMEAAFESAEKKTVINVEI